MTTTVQKNKVELLTDIQELVLEKLQKIYVSENLDDTITRITIDIPQVDIISWFQNQQVEQKIFWSDRDDKFAIAGIHVADLIQNGDDQTHPELFTNIQTRLQSSDASVRYFGGIKFDSSSPVTKEWSEFGTAAFVLPRFELIKRKESYQFVCNLNFPIDKESFETIKKQLSELSFKTEKNNDYHNEIVRRTDYPEQKQWMSRVSDALSDMNDDKYEKIVLARKTELNFKEDVCPATVMHNLLANTSNCFHFCFQMSTTKAFLGATPERLYYRNLTSLKCEAVAGTRSRGDDERHDRSLADELLQSKKDIKEHRYVIDSILDALSKFAKQDDEQNSGNVLLIQLAKVQHLIKRFKFILDDSVSDFDLLKSLHPTAAVGGYPKKNILNEIAELENFDRGWYAAPIGWISKDTSEFAVAIRSGLIDEKKMILYSGAGIIDGSIPESEWDEIENKISNFLKILQS